MSATEHDVVTCMSDVKFNGIVELNGVEYEPDYINAHIQEFFGACTEQLSHKIFENWCDMSDFAGETILYEAFDEFGGMLVDAIGEDAATEMLDEGLVNANLSDMEYNFVMYLIRLAKEKTGKDTTEV